MAGQNWRMFDRTPLLLAEDTAGRSAAQFACWNLFLRPLLTET
jgi:hypothetical protein